jgi:hypothetical protein
MRYPKISAQSITQRRAWNVAELADRYGVSKGFIRQRLRELNARRVGRRVLILDEDAKAFFEPPTPA